MSTTHHPLTDELMCAIQAAPGDFFTRLRAAFDAGREHEREHAAQDRPAEITDEMVEAAAQATHSATAWPSTPEIIKDCWRRHARAALSAALAAAPADPYHDPRPWQDCTRADIREGDLVERPCLGVVRVGVAHHQDEDGDWRARNGWVLTCGDRWPLRRIPAPTAEKDPAMTETTTPAEPLARTLLAVPAGHGAPHHDADRIKADDYVAQVDESGYTRVGIAHHQDQDGDWEAEDGTLITLAVWRADRPDALTVWPAPTPPAEEVQLPTEHPAHLTDLEGMDGVVCAYMALDYRGYWRGVDQDGRTRQWLSSWIIACTLPDGTRARRDGEHKNGEPRFIKEGEK